MKIKPIIMHGNKKNNFFYIEDLKFRSMIFTHGSYNYRIYVYYFLYLIIDIWFMLVIN